ncbi:MAG TPA: MFS transporter [Myxococcales bacterium]|nr:MFS transporter [Myxococcales bacterium]
MNLPTAARALRRPDFLKLWLGYVLSEMGSQVTQVAIAWQLYLLTHSAMSLGLVGLFRFLPILLMSLVGGVVADGLDRRRLMVGAQIALALNSAALAALTFLGRATPVELYGFAFLAGLARSFDNPARQALLPNLVPAEELPNALSLNASAWQAATLVGPVVGGALVAVSGPAAAYAVDAVTFGAMAVAAWSLSFRQKTRGAGAVSLRAAVEGLRFLRGTPVILWLMAIDFAACLLGGSMMLMPIYADTILRVGARGLGLLYAAPAGGALVAALLMAARPPIRRQGATVLVAVACYGLSIAAFGLSRDIRLSLLFLAASGAADTVSMIIRQTVRQLLTPDELRGRMTSVNMVFFMGGPQLGELEAGAVAKWLGAPFSVVSGGVLCVLAVLGFTAAAPSIRRLRDATAPAAGSPSLQAS